MRKISLILAFLVLLGLILFWLKEEPLILPDSSSGNTQEEKKEDPYEQALKAFKQKDFDLFSEKYQQLDDSAKAPFKKKIYFQMLNALKQNDLARVKQLKKLYDQGPYDPYLQEQLKSHFNRFDYNAFLTKTTPLLLQDDKSELKEHVHEILLNLVLIDSNNLAQSQDFIEEIKPLYSEEEYAALKKETAYLAVYFKNHPEKALALLELEPSIRENALLQLIETEHKSHLNHYLKYASHNGLLLRSDYPHDDLHESALNNLEYEAFEDALEDLELLSRLDPEHADARKAFAFALFDQGHYYAVIQELKHVHSLDAKTTEILAISEVQAGDKAIGIAHLKTLKNPSLDISKRILALSDLDSRDYLKALIKLNQIKKVNGEDLVFAAFLDYKLNRHKRAEKQIKLMKPYLRNSKTVRALELEILSKLGKQERIHELAEEEILTFKPSPLYKNLFDEIENQFPIGLQLSNYHLSRGDHHKAIIALKDAPDNFSNRLTKLDLLSKSQRWNEAYAVLNELLKDEIPEEKKGSFEGQAGSILYHVGLPLDAWPHFERWESLVHPSSEYLSERVSTLIDLKRYDLAWERLSKAPESYDLKKLEAASKIEKFSDFDELLEKILSKKETLTQKERIELARILFFESRPERAREILPQGEIDSENAPLLFTLYTEIAKFKEAAPFIDRLEKDPSFEAKKALGFYYDRLNDPKKSSVNYKLALDQKPYDQAVKTIVSFANKSYSEISQLLPTLSRETLSDMLLLAQGYILEGDLRKNEEPESYYKISWDKAGSLAEKLTKSAPFSPQAFLLKGEVESRLLSLNLAADDFKKALELSVTYPKASQELAEVLVKQKKGRESVRILEEALNQNPYDPLLWKSLGIIQKNIGNTLESIDAWQNYTLLKPKDPAGFIALSELSSSLNNPEDAIKSLSQAIALDPKNDQTRKKLKRLMADPLLNLTHPEKKKLEELTK